MVKGLPCWPSQPDFEQLLAGDELAAAGIDWESQWDERAAVKKTLRVGEDFDCVVLGVGLGVIPATCGEIVARDVAWRTMTERVKSISTQAFQLWLDRDASELGWTGDAVNLSGFVEPFDTWADLSHLAVVEDWSENPRSIAYFCNVLPEPQAIAEDDPHGSRFVAWASEQVRSNCVSFLAGEARHMWPLAHSPSGEFCWHALRSPLPEDPGAALHGTDRFRSQYWTANVRPSDRYSQALPGTTKYRISPLDRSYDNLTIAGDWTSCSINMGCVEAAVMSGLLAAHAISGFPSLKDIVGYDHP